MSACKKCHLEYGKTDLAKKKDAEYYQRNKKIINKKQAQYNKKYRKELKPWFISYDKAKQRCTNPKHYGYPWYGGRGIQFLMTLDDFEFLWKRDKAHLMDRPSIDRKNPDGNYEINNCRFIELELNLKRKRKKGTSCLKKK